ncbi:MAG: hypothetical protein ACD_3C00084G0013 [uncultured bacterium (gcode 4)]|uniref:Response regulatory domain-containing protein n=1 Tax=uncultured bacterium (gcode 4) TaxID=1234023 RepID=K2G1Y1_9BACT|nr:MAG: hypothetical protein ACD_3C00084G0013 [uncultured bacterium (gcode 4)]
MKKILILEDNIDVQESFSNMFKWKVVLLQAHNLKEAEELYEKNKDDLNLIALDGNVPKNWSRFKDTVELARHIRVDYKNALYSISQDDEIKDEFKKIWFDWILGMKYELIKKVMDIIEWSKA